MKTLWSCTCAATLSLAAVVLPCPAADSAWNGTWKFNEAKSKLTGDTFTVTMKPDGTYHYSNGSTMEYDFACNGKSYSTLADRTITCTGEPGTGFDFTSMANGTALSKSHRALSADGKTMQIDGTSMQADGTTATYAETYQRVSGSTGMAGKWKNVKDKVSEPGVVEISVSGDVIHLKYPSSKATIDAKLDGSDSPVTGPNIPQGALESFKAEGTAKVHVATKYKDKVLSEGTWTLSADGKTFTVDSWAPGKMAEKETAVYDKQ